jgi:hypothetical protein
MPILQVAGEDVDFLGSSTVANATGGQFRSGFARCGIWSSLYTKSLPFVGGAVTSAWFSFYNAFNSTYGTTPTLIAGLVDQATSASGLWIGSGSANPLRYALYKFDGTTATQLAQMTYDVLVHNEGTFFRLDVQLVNYGATATVTVYLDGIQVMTYTGDVTVAGTTNLSCIGLYNKNGASYGNANSSSVSEIIVSDADTRALSLVTMAATGVGNTDAWTGAYTDENEISLNDATDVYSNTPSQDEDFNITDPPAGVYSVTAVMRVARASATSGASATEVGLGFYIGSTHYPGTAQSPTTSWEPYQELYANDPSTGVPFLYTSLAALQSNLRSS